MWWLQKVSLSHQCQWLEPQSALERSSDEFDVIEASSIFPFLCPQIWKTVSQLTGIPSSHFIPLAILRPEKHTAASSFFPRWLPAELCEPYNPFGSLDIKPRAKQPSATLLLNFSSSYLWHAEAHPQDFRGYRRLGLCRSWPGTPLQVSLLIWGCARDKQ